MKHTSNKTLGNRFEKELCESLSKEGFWCHNLAQNQTGQPADVIAAKNGIPILIDCKACSNNSFPLSRIECNQEGAMTLWKATGNEHCYFAMKLENGKVYMVSFDELSSLRRNGKGIIKEHEFRYYKTLPQWLEEFS